jgi:hypothetical protein
VDDAPAGAVRFDTDAVRADLMDDATLDRAVENL